MKTTGLRFVAVHQKDRALAKFLDRLVSAYSRRLRELDEDSSTWLAPPFLSVVVDELPSGELRKRIVSATLIPLEQADVHGEG